MEIGKPKRKYTIEPIRDPIRDPIRRGRETERPEPAPVRPEPPSRP